MAGNSGKSSTPRKSADADGAVRSTAATTGDEVTLMLAHPITREQDKRYLGLPEDGEYGPGSKVVVNKNGAQALIASGLAAVETENEDAVRAALGEPVVEPSGGNASGE